MSSRNEIQRLLSLKPMEGPAPITFSKREVEALKDLAECKEFTKLADHEVDQHNVRFYLNEITSLTCGESAFLAKKLTQFIEAKKIDSNLKNLNEAMADSMADDHEGDDHGMYGVGSKKGPEAPKGDADKGAKQDAEHGDAPKGQDGYLGEDEMPDFIKAKIDAKKKKEETHEEPDGDEMPNFMKKDESDEDDEMPIKDESEDEDMPKEESEDDPPEVGAAPTMDEPAKAGPKLEKKLKERAALQRKLKENAAEIAAMKAPPKEESEDPVGGEGGSKPIDAKETEVPEEAPSPPDEDSPAKDATYKDGAMQNEAEDHKTVAKEPGKPEAGSAGNHPELQKGDVEDVPDYSAKQVKAEDPSKSDLNKGPAAVTTVESFERIESKVVSMLEAAGFKPGTKAWANLYCKGFERAIAGRAKFLGAKLNEARNVTKKNKK